MDGDVILVTGANRGLGLEVADQLADLGHTVVRGTRQDPRGPGDLPLDIADPTSVASAAARLRDTYGRLDVLVNNAAAYVDWAETGSTADLDAAEAVLRTNLLGTWRLVQAVLPLLRESPNPRIVNVSSGAGSHADPDFGLAARAGAAASYGISKAALNALSSTLAAELPTFRVNAVCPGLTATYPGAEQMGARPASQRAKGVVWAATLPPDGPTGGFFRDEEPLGW